MSLHDFITKIHSQRLCIGSDSKKINSDSSSLVLADDDSLIIPCILSLKIKSNDPVFVTRNDALVTPKEFGRLCSTSAADNNLKVFAFFSKMRKTSKRSVITLYKDSLSPVPCLEMLDYNSFCMRPWLVKYNISVLSELLGSIDLFANNYHIHFNFETQDMHTFKFESVDCESVKLKQTETKP